MNEIIRAARRGDIKFLENNALTYGQQIGSIKKILEIYHPDIYIAIFNDENNDFSTILRDRTPNLETIDSLGYFGFFD